MTRDADEFIRPFPLARLARWIPSATTAFWAMAIEKRKLARCRELSMPANPPSTEESKDYRERYKELTGCSLLECPSSPSGPHGNGCDSSAQSRSADLDQRYVIRMVSSRGPHAVSTKNHTSIVTQNRKAALQSSPTRFAERASRPHLHNAIWFARREWNAGE